MVMNLPVFSTGMGIVSTIRPVVTSVCLPDIAGKAHNLTIPRHKPLRVGTLHGILKDVAEHQGISFEKIIMELFG